MPGMTPRSEVGGASSPYMRLVSNEELEAREQEQREAERRQNEAHILQLASEIRQRWEVAKNAKREVEQEMLRDYRQRNGQYDPDKLADIRQQGGSEIYMMLTSVKCRAAEAWVRDVMMPPDDNPWKLRPSPEPDMPPDIEQRIGRRVGYQMAEYVDMYGMPMTEEEAKQRTEEVRKEIEKEVEQEAEERAAKMEQRIADQFHEGGWRQAMDEAIQDVVTTKAGFIAGPIIRRRKRLEWKQGKDGWEPSVEEKLVEEYERVSPLDIYPAPDAVSVYDSYLFRKHRLSQSDLEAMIGVEGYDDEAIRAALADYHNGHREYEAIDQQRREIEERDQSEYFNNSEKIEALQYWGPASGRTLEEWGIPVDDPAKQYEVEVWLVGQWVIKAELDEDPASLRPISKAHYEVIPGAFWGRGVAELMRDTQAMCNASARALANNMGIASGPQVVVNDINRLPAGEALTKVYPWKLWQFEGDSAITSSHRPPVEFYQPTVMAKELMEVYDYYARLSDDYTGIPAYTYGQTDVGGAGETASGLSMLLNQASKGIRRVIAHVDHGLVEPSVHRQYIFNMLYDPDESIKGDLYVEPQGSQSLVAREQEQVRRTEFLNATANDYDMAIIGKAGRAALLRESAKQLNVDVDEIVPDPDEIRRQEEQERLMQMQMLQQQAAQGGAPQEGRGGPRGPQQTQKGQGTNPAGEPAGGQDFNLQQGR